MKAEKIYFILVFILSLLFIIFSIIAIPVSKDLITSSIIILQIFLLSNLTWLTWKKFKGENQE